jgi:diguanylate cyclase
MPADVESLLRSPQSYQLARKAIASMEAHNVWPTALNFELWLHYVGDSDSTLALAVDHVLRSGEAFTEAVGEALAAQFLPKAKLNDELIEAGDALSKGLHTVSQAIESAHKTSEVYGQQLATASASLEAEDAGKIKVMVESLTLATRRVQQENRVLETQLADTTAEMSRLREHLDQVRREAMTDPLTDLANRKCFDETLERACADADRHGAPLSLAILDIDHFKIFNDTWGHQTGDQVIRFVASVIDRVGRKPRLAARYGGEEFALIFPEENGARAMIEVERIRTEVASRVLKRRSTNEDLGAVTLSGGVAERRRGESLASLIDRADNALYASKRGGRNRITMAGDSSSVVAA